MRVTFIGHAGLFVETDQGSILCDPWFTPAFHASWFPFPSNRDVDLASIAKPDFLFVSHLHFDHFDPEFLSSHVPRGTTVLLPDFPTDHLRRELEDLGFRSFIQTTGGQPLELDGGLRVMINALVTPTDGPLGDSGLAVDDGTNRIFNQNDSRPVDIDLLSRFGPYDGHFLQFSGGIWYPMVYDFPPEEMERLIHAKRTNEMARAARYAREVGATHLFPCAGPPCFLDDDLFVFNDLDGEAETIFPDQTVFLRYLDSVGMTNGHLMVPGTTATFGPKGSCDVAHPLPDETIRSIFSDKRSYLERYQKESKGFIEATKASWPRGKVDVVAALKEWWEPLLAEADLTCTGVNGRVLIEAGDEQQVVVDFLDREVRRWNGEPCRYTFTFEPGLVEACVLAHDEDWVNSLFLSCRFRAHRDGPYNEYVYSFFKSLSPERMAYVEKHYAQFSTVRETFECEGYLVQRRCPHLKADLKRFAKVEDGILTCQMHGWQFDLVTGRCLTADDRRLFTRPAPDQPEPPTGVGEPGATEAAVGSEEARTQASNSRRA
jgi:UDP-MurNAc hydroxylase